MLRACALAALVALGSLPAAANAQQRRPTEPVALPGYGVAAPDGPEAIHLNPAALAGLAGWSLGYLHTDGDAESGLEGRGDALYAAAPLLFGLYGGVAVDQVRPVQASLPSRRTMVSFALAYALAPTLSVGGAFRVLAGAGRPDLNGLVTADLSASWRPADHLALGFAARDIFAPGLQMDGRVPRSFALSLAVRPTGTRALTLDFAGLLDDDGRVGLRGAVDLAIPFVGRLLAAAELEGLDESNPELRVVTGLAVDWGSIGVGGGVWASDDRGRPGWYVSARLDGPARRGLPQGAYVLDLTVSGVGSRGILRLLDALERARREPEVAAVLLRPRGSGLGLAYAQEIRLAVDALQEAGKPVVCHLDDATGSEWYACAGATRILGDPAGGVRLAGVASETMLLGDLLREVGVRADFVRIGRYKSAIEQFHNRRSTRAAREERDAILDSAYRRLLGDIGADLGIERAEAEALVDDGPFLPDDALEAGLLHGLADGRDLGAELAAGVGGRFSRRRRLPWTVPERWGRRPRVGVVVIDGNMVDGRNLNIPILGITGSGGVTISETIDRMAADPAIGAIVLRIDSPGGSVLAADQIYRAVLRAKERKPVIASLGAVAASGGYYVAAPCDEIWADPSTLTGSIGVWFGKVDFVPLADRIGVAFEQRRRGEHAGATSLFRPFTGDERATLARMVRHWYRVFLERVSEGRNMGLNRVDRLARGRVFSGDEAVDEGLVDHRGSFLSALNRARQAAGLPADAPFEVAPGRPVTLVDHVLDAVGVAAAADGSGPAAQSDAAAIDALAPEIRRVMETAMTLRQLRQGAALALMPEVVIPR